MTRHFNRTAAQAAVNELRPLVFELASLMRRHRGETPDGDSLQNAALWHQADSAVLAHTRRLARFYELVEVITATGALLKDPEAGLLDFPARLGEREILLCWRLGEESIGFYHDPDKGFRQRRPLRD